MGLPELLQPSTVAESLNLSRQTSYRWQWEGKHKGIKIAETVRITKESVEKLRGEVWAGLREDGL